jgi:site-specific recombinase XerD
MLATPRATQQYAPMSKAKKRTRITPNKSAANSITIQEVLREKGGSSWVTHLVQGWKEDGKWKRKQFKDRKEAERFAALKRVEIENQGQKLSMVLSPLTEKQTEEAVKAFSDLAGTYSLAQAVDFFLKNHRPPEYVTTITEGLAHYLEDKERDGVRDRTVTGARLALKAFADAIGDPQLHTVTRQNVEAYLRGLKGKDGVTPAKRKSWNTNRNEISQFFGWVMKEDLATNRPWCFSNPVDGVKLFSNRQVAEQRPPVVTTPADDLQEMLTYLMQDQGGAMVKYFALAYFAGIRPNGELEKLSEREAELINLKTGKIFIPAAFSKVKADRQVTIPPNLLQWLKAYKGFPIVPKNFGRTKNRIRDHFGMRRDETRHSFISYHVAVHRSIGLAALEAGNSESMVRKHYLNLHTREEGEAFFSIVPDMKTRRAVIDTTAAPEPQKLLRAV